MLRKKLFQVKNKFVTKYGFLLSYVIFFIISQGLLILLATTTIINSPFSRLSAPTCTLGFIIIDGIISCGFQLIVLFFQFLTVSSEFFIIELLFIIPFIIVLGMIIADWLRGNA